MRRDLPDIVKQADLRGVSAWISTNAAAATREVVETLKEVKICSFKVSMKGPNERVYDSIRGESGSFREEGNAQCAACCYFPKCRGGCRARALLADHDINLPDGNCALAHSERQTGIS